jgi:hypothetical protein
VLLLADGPFSAAELVPRPAAAAGSAPLIVFSTSASGRPGFALTRLGAWGARLAQLGCGGLVGSLWPVTGRAALTFARVFYDGLAGGLPLGRAVTRARRRVHEEFPNDPTWLAYRCFADPLARVDKPAER